MPNIYDMKYFEGPPVTSSRKMAAGDFTTTSANLEQNTGVEIQKIIVQNNCGDKMVGLLHETGSKEIVIVCHGFKCTKYDGGALFCIGKARDQCLSLRFFWKRSITNNHRKEVDDLHAVIQHFTAANRVVTAIIGHSKGGNCVVLYASLHHDIPIVFNVCGTYNMHMGLEERLGKYYLERAKKDGFIDVKSHTG
ncbi:hypothetical protein L1987_70095 [Smallanthus sonchifolius]|uniref:Uncharacterized protein n=1 Tax=Smallanthus sonchifolius TaxID=185202 RepID=A0ACB9AP78_9ASTR|nr:hypothetical protein L1987_70095 [Smallanthus sonchifolius]